MDAGPALSGLARALASLALCEGFT